MRNIHRPARYQRTNTVRSLGLSLLCVLLAGILAACGSTEAGQRGQAAADVELSVDLQTKYNAIFSDDFAPPPTDVPAAVPGRSVWLISCGRNFPVCTRVDDQFEEAGRDIIGWDLNIFDSAGDAQKAISGIRQAISARADAIATIATDCAGIRNALLEARAAGIPVFNYHGTDCPGDPLFAGTPAFAGIPDIVEHSRASGKSAATLLAALLAKRGVSGGEILEVKSLGQEHHDAYWDSFEKQLRVDCPDCALVPVEFTNSQVPNPAAQVWKSAMIARPEAVGLAYNSDTYLSLGLASAIKASSNTELVVCCGSGEDPGALRDGVVTGANFVPYEYHAWGLIDIINQFFAGVDPRDFPDQGGGLLFTDAEHELPLDGAGFDVPVDYRTLRAEAWTATP